MIIWEEIQAKKNDSLGDFLRYLRIRERVTLRRVENISGVSNAYISQLENNKIKNPSAKTLLALLGAYGEDLNSIADLLEKE